MSLPPLRPILNTADVLRDQVRSKVSAAIQGLFPLDLKGRTLEIKDVAVHPQEFSPEQQKHALLTSTSLHEPVIGTLVLKDASGKVIDEAKHFTLAKVPYFTERHTIIMDGNEYQVANQIRRRPGVYTQRSSNGELSTIFNLSRGRNLSMEMAPETGAFYITPADSSARIPLYPVLRALGVPHTDIAKHWSTGVADANKAKHGHQEETAIARLYEKLIHPSQFKAATPHAEKVEIIRQKFDLTQMDPKVTELTLGQAFDKVSSPSLMAAGRKLLDVHEGKTDVDDSDSLAYKTFHSVDDFLAERLRLFGRTWKMKVKQRFTGKDRVRDALAPQPFTDTLKRFITGSSLTAIPTGINPIELIDHAVKVTSLGEGGISEERAIPYDARLVHPTHYGILDPVRTPESGAAGIDIRATIGARRDEHGNLYTCVKDLKSGQNTYLPAGDIMHHTIAFPHQELKGEIDAMVKGVVQRVPAKAAAYQFIHNGYAYSPATNLVPMLYNIQGNRAIMGSKMQTQALPLLEREAPYVQVKSHAGDESYEKMFTKLIVPTAPVDGTVTKVEGGYIYIRPHGTKTAGTFPTGIGPDGVRKHESKVLAGFTFHVDRPKGFIKRWKFPDGHEDSFTYPVDYGYLKHHLGEDGEPLDVFIGDDPGGYHGRFDKGKTEYGKDGKPTGKILPDESKFYIGLTKKERDHILHEFKDVVLGHETFKDFSAFQKAIAPFKKESEFLEWELMKTAAPKDDGLIKIPYLHDFPFPSKTYLHHDVTVKAGDKVTSGQRMAGSNFTKDDTLALGKNLRVAYMAYHGMNSNDAVVISEGCARKLTSEHMYREVYPVTARVELSTAKHKAYFAARRPPTAYAGLDSDGVIKKGATVQPHDLLVAALVPSTPSASDLMLGKISRSLVKPYQDVALEWHHTFQGEVVEVIRSPGQVAILVKTREPMQIGDKLAGRYGNKGVVSLIVPDHEMVQDEAKRPVDIIMTSAGVVSRINPAQIIEGALGKIAEKTGKPILVDNAKVEDKVAWASDLLKQHGLKDKEHLFDPKTGRTIKGPDGKGVFIGRSFIFKLFKSTDTNFAAHGVGPYDVNEQPSRPGGEEAPKGLGKMEFDALIAHGARNVIREAASIRSQKNEEFWKALQLGLPLPAPKPSFIFGKFTAMLEGAGVKVDKRGSKLKLLPMTDKDILARSSGAIENNKTLIAKNLQPEKGGLFDPNLTGGPAGTRYAHIKLHEAIPNPVFEDPIRHLLGLTSKDYLKTLREKGGAHVRTELAKIDVPKTIDQLRKDIPNQTATDLDLSIKKLKYLEALHEEGLKPQDAYVLGHVPVVPPVFRPIVRQPNNPGQLTVADANKLYIHLLDANTTLKDTVLDSDVGAHREKLYHAVGAVFGTHEPEDEELRGQKVKGFLTALAGAGSPKNGFFQKKLMKRMQDVSGRGTAAPDPNLNMDQVGLPEGMLWSMFKPFLIARLVRNGWPAVQAQDMVEKKSPSAQEALRQELKERPVMINRAPTLHRWGIIGAYAVPVQGKTIRVSPFIEKGLNLDYDGDTLQIHAPVTPGGIQDTRHMLLSNQVLSDQSRNKLLAFPQHEALIGIEHATSRVAAGPKKTFKTVADMQAAWRRGEITLSDGVVIKA